MSTTKIAFQNANMDDVINCSLAGKNFYKSKEFGILLHETNQMLIKQRISKIWNENSY